MASEHWILVVDDDRQNLEVLGEALSGAGFQVDLASGGGEAIERGGHGNTTRCSAISR